LELKQYIYIPIKPIKPMNKEDQLILQVKENKNKQKRVTIPKKSEIKDKDYIKVEKVK